MFVQIILVRFGLLSAPPSGKELLTRLTIRSLCILTICNFILFPFLVLGLDLGSDYSSSSSLHTCYFYTG